MHNLSETSSFDVPVTVPDDGDARAAASVDGAFQALTNRTKYLQNALGYGQLWPRVSVRGDGTNTLPCGAFSVIIGGVRLVYSGGNVVAGTLGANAWLCLYVYNNAGSPAFEVSADGPDASGLWKSTDIGAKRFLTSLRTDGSGLVVPFVHLGGEVRWQDAHNASDTYRVNNSTVNTTDQLLTIPSALIPPHARQVDLLVRVESSDGAPQAVFVGGDVRAATYWQQFVDASAASQGAVRFVVSASQQIRHRSGTANVGLNTYVSGYVDGG